MLSSLQTSWVVGIGLFIFLFINVLCFTLNINKADLRSNERHVVIKKKLVTMSNDINEIRDVVFRELDLVTEYHDTLIENYVVLEKNSLNIQEYIKKNYTTVPAEVAAVIAVNISKLCVEYNINQSLIVGLMEVESAFNPFAISKVGARGLLQVRPSVWEKELGIKSRSEFHDIETGIDSGIRVLLIYLNRSSNNVTEALQGYNGAANCIRFSDKVYAAMVKFDKFLEGKKG